jgi:hypothetical protein
MAEPLLNRYCDCIHLYKALDEALDEAPTARHRRRTLLNVLRGYLRPHHSVEGWIKRNGSTKTAHKSTA